MWIWEIPSGILYRPKDESGNILAAVAHGYSGHTPHINDVNAQNIANFGPIPVGKYTIQAPVDTDTHGPYVLRLQPDPSNEMYGRAGFLIHGDKIGAPGTGSEGCIILDRATREKIWQSNDHELTVTLAKLLSSL